MLSVANIMAQYISTKQTVGFPGGEYLLLPSLLDF